MTGRGLKNIRVAKAAVAKRYSMQEMADAMGVSKPTYAKIERDPSRMTVLQAKRAAAYLGCPVEDLFYLPNE